MCLIIHNPKAKQIPFDYIDSALCMNPDGFGIFYHDTGEIVYSMNEPEIEQLLDTGRPYTAHFRYATSGPVSKANCHPFHIDDTYALMMNGTIERLVSKSSVDTLELCKILNGLSEEKILAVLRTYPARFALLNKKTGQATVVNRDLWHKKGGALYSKDNCFDSWQCGSSYGKYKPLSVGKYKPLSVGNYSSIKPEDPDTWPDDIEEWAAYTGYDGSAPDDDAYDVAPDGSLLLASGQQTTTVAVYGTLKKGHGNHRLLAKSKFVGAGTTSMAYPMIQSGIPYVIDEAGKGNRITVEVYRVTADELRALDSLEGHPDWYVRRQKSVQLATGGTVSAWIYVIPAEKGKALTGMDWRKEKLLSEYTGK
jgi:gamma-glutamylaminecyclotransferase